MTPISKPAFLVPCLVVGLLIFLTIPNSYTPGGNLTATSKSSAYSPGDLLEVLPNAILFVFGSDFEAKVFRKSKALTPVKGPVFRRIAEFRSPASVTLLR